MARKPEQYPSDPDHAIKAVQRRKLSTEFSYVTRVVTPQAGWTRMDLLLDAQEQMSENVRKGIVLFFSAEPLEL